VELPFL